MGSARRVHSSANSHPNIQYPTTTCIIIGSKVNVVFAYKDQTVFNLILVNVNRFLDYCIIILLVCHQIH